MPESLVVCNTSPLLYLHQVSCLGILYKLYGRIAVPPPSRRNRWWVGSAEWTSPMSPSWSGSSSGLRAPVAGAVTL
ncbi:MAG TPA: hypothetical protein VGC53_01475 [Vicinamibacteria bacterium]